MNACVTVAIEAIYTNVQQTLNNLYLPLTIFRFLHQMHRAMPNQFLVKIVQSLDQPTMAYGPKVHEYNHCNKIEKKKKMFYISKNLRKLLLNNYVKWMIKMMMIIIQFSALYSLLFMSLYRIYPLFHCFLSRCIRIT